MTKSKKLRVLREIYDSIPSAGCLGLCADSCSTIPVLPFELEQLEAAAGRKLPTMASAAMGAVILGTEIGSPCPLLVIGRCSAYEQRPIICRAFGSVEGMPCPHGCRPSGPTSDADLMRNMKRIADL